eukprot:6467393-Amphidinium_carterae.1
MSKASRYDHCVPVVSNHTEFATPTLLTGGRGSLGALLHVHNPTVVIVRFWPIVSFCFARSASSLERDSRRITPKQARLPHDLR